jgi:hypothetical protein
MGLSKIPFEKKYNEDIVIARKLTPQQKLDLISQLHSLSWELINTKDKEKKLKLYQKEHKLKRQNFKKFITAQLKKVTKGEE